MAITAGRMVKNGDVVFCGTGLSLIAATVAKKMYAPESIIFFETGGIDAELPELPISVADLRVMYRTCMNAGLLESFSILSHKKVHTKAFLGAAQIDDDIAPVNLLDGASDDIRDAILVVLEYLLPLRLSDPLD